MSNSEEASVIMPTAAIATATASGSKLMQHIAEQTVQSGYVGWKYNQM